jgi:stage II sporulation protein D
MGQSPQKLAESGERPQGIRILGEKIMRKKFLSGTVWLALMLTATLAWGRTAPQLIRIGLAWGQAEIRLSLTATDRISKNYEIGAAPVTFAAEIPVVFTASGDNIFLNGVSLGSGPVGIAPGNTFLTWNGRKYRGEFLISLHNGKLSLVDRLPLEEYLRGVLPKEVIPQWPLAALKAQAIAARTYTLANLGKHQADGFDLCNTVDCQVYEGASCETPTTDLAVAETAGKVLAYQGKLIYAFYHSCSGGSTQDVETMWSYKPDFFKADYLKAAPDWDQNSPKVEWYRSVEWGDLQLAVTRNYPQVGRLTRIAPAAMTKKGKVLKVRLTGTDGDVVLSGEQFRFLVNLNSSNLQMAVIYGPEPSVTLWWVKNSLYPDVYLANYDIPGLVAEAIVPPWDTPDPWQWLQDKTPLRVVVRGSGWGHRVGMSQWGAKGMADAGFNEIQILKHYYQNASIVKAEELSKNVGK